MAIDTEDFGKLLACFETAKQNSVTLYDIMTERFEITSILQKEFSLIPNLYGEQLPGTPDDPAVVKESVHHFAKTVSGTTLQRPPWYFDVKQQGEGITDVATHLVDLVQWTLFPNQIIDYQQDIDLIDAKHWTTPLSNSQFKEVTGYGDFPDYLADHISNDSLYVYSNGEILYSIKGVHAKVSVIWNYVYPEGGGDTHFSSMKGSRATLSIRQGAAQNYIPRLFIALNGSTENDLYDAVQLVAQKYPGIELKQADHTEWEITIPDTYRNGHEAHFAQVTENFLTYIQTGLPQWEVPNMIAKYYVTTRALEIAQQSE
jgi:predicted dehydrogenase